MKKIKRSVSFLTEVVSKKIWLTFSIITTVFIVCAGAVYYFLDQKVEDGLAEQILHRQQITVRAGSISIHAFLENVEKSMIFMSKEPDLILLDESSQLLLDRYIEEWEETPLVTTILINLNGDIIYSSDNQGGKLKTPINVSERDYFKSAIEAEKVEVFMESPIFTKDVGAYANRFVLPLSVPLFKNGQVNGVLSVGILVSDLEEKYLSPLKISEQSQIYFLDSKGVFLSSHYPEFVGKDLDEVFKDIEFDGKEKILFEVKEYLKKKTEGKFELVVPNNLTNPTKYEKMLFSYSPVKYGKQSGFLVITTPTGHIDYYIGPIFSIYSKSIYIFVFYTIVFSTISMVILRVVQKISYLKGYSKGRKEK